MEQRATAGAGVLEPDERGGAIIVANDGREVARNRPFGPVAAGGDGADSRPCRQTEGAYPRLNAQAPIVPAPDACRRVGRSPPKHFQRKCVRRKRRAPAVNAEAEAKR